VVVLSRSFDPEAYVPQEPNSQTPTVLRIRRRKSADMPRARFCAVQAE
jgi:hypothetical protein